MAVNGGDFMEGAKAGTRIIAIDGLRGFFAAVVIVLHYQEWFEVGLSEPWVGTLARGAIYAVCGFFVISGTSMAIAYRSTPPTNARSTAAFYLKRFFRIAPLYYFVLAIHVAGRAAGCISGDVCQIDLPLFLANMTFVFGFGQAAIHSKVVAGWSIGIEWIFYFIFPILFWIATRSWRWIAALMAVSISALVAWDVWYLSTSQSYWPAYAQFPAYLVYFVAGIAIGLFVTPDNLARWSGLAIPLFAVTLTAYLVLDLTAGRPYVGGVDAAGPTAWIFAILTCITVGACTFIPLKSKWATSVAKTAGNLSYGVYLLHFPVSIGIRKLGISGALGALAGVLCTVVLALFVYRYLERPMISLGSRLSKSIMGYRRELHVVAENTPNLR